MTSVESQELEVEQANERFYRAFESLDIQQMEAVWAVKGTVKCIHPGWALRSGWPAVRDSWVMIFNHAVEMRFDVTDVDIAVKGDLAWVTCVEQVKTKVDGEPHASRILATNLYIRHSSGWLLIHHHGSPIFSSAG